MQWPETPANLATLLQFAFKFGYLLVDTSRAIGTLEFGLLVSLEIM